jgi:CheY-like chemotaxis protein
MRLRGCESIGAIMATILVVDDNIAIRKVISYTLERSGYRVITAADALEALACLSQYAVVPQGLVDLLILDVAMPYVDGLTLLKQLRADDRYQVLPIIILTASCDDQDQAAALLAGANEFLTKPTSSRELLDVVKRNLVY